MNKKILIIEDESTLNKSVVDFLSAENFQVLSALDGEAGLEMAKKEIPDLILLDIILPEKDGYEVLDELKKDEKTKNIPVILLTNLESQGDISKAFEKGATTYLVKSNYKLQDIAEKIKTALGVA